MKTTDNRTSAQALTHTVFIAGTDRFMTGWGKAEGGKSIAVWACRPEDADIVLRWAKSRGDMLRVREVSQPYRPRGPGHTHIYVVTPGHIEFYKNALIYG